MSFINLMTKPNPLTLKRKILKKKVVPNATVHALSFSKFPNYKRTRRAPTSHTQPCTGHVLPPNLKTEKEWLPVQRDF
ncbi:uncharacterized protein G2W53_020761 [Senna tora]|uniref:Uncharacterized protein n=1 Tax=Senna tora TaxID=362788 RepID=A0A834TJU8_9FABA|nr:uncharacterized protein G2W53_020761 [Senna tora]